MDRRPLDLACGGFRSRLRRLLVQAGVARGAIVALALLPPLLAADFWLHLAWPWRLLSLAAYLGSLAACLGWSLVKPLSRRWSTEEILSYVDSVVPREQAMLLELHELAEGREIQELESPAGRDLAAEAVRELAPLVDRVSWEKTLYRRRAVRWMRAAGALAVLFVAAAVPLREYLSIGCERLFNPFSTRRWPHRTTIEVEAPATGWKVAQMEPFPVKAVVTGVVPPQVTLAYRSEQPGYWIREKLPVRADGRVAYTFPEVRDPLEFTLEGGDFKTDPYRIDVVARPYLKTLVARYEYPPYAGLPDREVKGGQLSGLEGTRVRLRFESSMPLRKAVFAPTGAPPEEMPLLSETRFEKSLLLATDGSYAVELYEKNGFREAKPERYEIRVTPDHPPEVDLLSPGRDLVATAQASVDVSFRARDDFGLSRVEFLYQVDEGPPQPLSDRITGPLKQDGRVSEGRFRWDLRRMSFPETARVRYFVRVQDVNPTGRGKADSARLEIRLLKPSLFHRDAFERATALLREGFIAWRNQLHAWKRGDQWLAAGKPDDPLWREMEEKQDQALRAVRAMELHLETLTRDYELNRMGLEFMAGRLGVIVGLLKRLTDTEAPAIADGLRRARPSSDAEAAPERLQALRSAALGRFRDNQKMSVLVLERLLRKLFDWRDLQTSTLATTMLHEDQEEVVARTEKIAPRFIGKNILDLSDEDQEELLTLGKQQRTIFDTETALEAQLSDLMYKAEKQRRRTIRDPLMAAFRGLRDNRVNDDLKRSAQMIENNQPFEILKNQKAALRALHAVKAGLVLAGQKVDEDAPLALSTPVSQEDELDPDKAKVAQGEERPPDDPAGVAAVPAPDDLERVLPEGSDPLSAAIRLTLELQDNVLARTRYLDKNASDAEMPRFVRLKQGMLAERQEAALKAMERALEEAAKAGSPALKEILSAARDECRQSRTLLVARDVSPCAQQIQADAIAALGDLLQRIALEQAVAQSVQENRSGGGVDAFKRSYLLRDKDLDAAVAILAGADHARLLQKDVARKLGRFTNHPPRGPQAGGVEAENRGRAAEAQKKAAALVAEAVARTAALSGDAAARVREGGAESLRGLSLGELAGPIAAGGRDAEVGKSVQEAAKALGSAVQGLRDLLEERAKPKEVVAGADPKADAPKKITPEEFEKLSSPETLIERLKSDTGLPPEVRERMITALGRGKDFPAKYRQLLAAYFASFVRKETGK